MTKGNKEKLIEAIKANLKAEEDLRKDRGILIQNIFNTMAEYPIGQRYKNNYDGKIYQVVRYDLNYNDFSITYTSRVLNNKGEFNKNVYSYSSLDKSAIESGNQILV